MGEEVDNVFTTSSVGAKQPDEAATGTVRATMLYHDGSQRNSPIESKGTIDGKTGKRELKRR